MGHGPRITPPRTRRRPAVTATKHSLLDGVHRLNPATDLVNAGRRRPASMLQSVQIAPTIMTCPSPCSAPPSPPPATPPLPRVRPIPPRSAAIAIHKTGSPPLRKRCRSTATDTPPHVESQPPGSRLPRGSPRPTAEPPCSLPSSRLIDMRCGRVLGSATTPCAPSTGPAPPPGSLRVSARSVRCSKGRHGR